METAAKPAKLIPSLCHICHNFCGVLVDVRTGEIKRVLGNKDNPQNNGTLCPKPGASVSPESQASRPLYPMRRVGERGSGQWERISWDEAIDYCADKFQEIRVKYGPEAIAGIIGSQYRHHGMSTNRFLRVLGSPNIMCDDYICEGMAATADDVTVGEHITKYRYSADFENSKAILVVGANLEQAYNPKWKNIIPKARKNGCKLLVVDPRRSETAAAADLWVKIRPGTDAALFMGMINLVIQEGLYDKEFVEKWTVGFDKLAERARQYTLDRVAQITEVPAETIRELTLTWARNRPCSLHVGLGMHQYTNSTQTCRAAICLVAIMGSVDVPGGNIFLKGKSYPGYVGFWDIWSNPKYRLSREVEEKRLGAREYPLWSGPDSVMHCATQKLVWRAMLTGDPYPVRSLVVCSTNILLTHPDPKLIKQALLSLDFLPVVEFMMSPVAELADIILPTTHWSEETGADIITQPKNRVMAIRQPATKPAGECWDTMDMMIAISRRMVEKGYISQAAVDKHLQWKSHEDFLDWRLQETGVTLQELEEKSLIPCPEPKWRTYEQGGFHTPSGKVELYSSLFEKAGYDPLPGYFEYAESPRVRPDLTDEYPLVLSTGQRIYQFQHSRYRDVPSVRKAYPDPIVELSPQAAAERGIAEGDWVEVVTRNGKAKFRAKLREMYPTFVSCTHAWWFPEKGGASAFEFNANCLVNYEPCDHISTTPQVKGTPCQVLRLPAAEQERLTREYSYKGTGKAVTLKKGAAGEDEWVAASDD